MGYRSNVEAIVKIDINKVVDMAANDTVTTKGDTATLADTIKSSVKVLKYIYDDLAEVFVYSSFLRETFDEFLEGGEIHISLSEMKMYDLTRDLKDFVEKYGDVIVSLEATRVGEENGDIERFEVRNVDSKNTLFVGTPETTFHYEPA